ncbi:MAG: UPF0175 family protein [Candidatus Micrarchaeota archaeon]
MDLKCSYCDEITSCDCLENHNRYPEAKFMCEVCQTLCEMGESEDKLKNHAKHAEIKNAINLDNQAGQFADELVSETFEEMWKEEKEELRELSKKEIAEAFYYRGANCAVKTFLIAAEEENKKIEKAVEEYKAGRVSTGKAAEIASLTWSEMNDELARRKIPLHYTKKELEEDLNV